MMNPSQDRSYIGWWPTVTGDDWCGEFKPVTLKIDQLAHKHGLKPSR